MKLALTHNLRLTDSEDEAEFDSAETVEAIANALGGAGHEVERIEVSGPASHLASRLEAFGPDLIFNIAEGKRGRTREAFYPAFFEELGFPYTGSDAYVLTVTLDKWLTKLVLAAHGIDSPRGRLVTPSDLPRISEGSLPHLALPVIVKPNYEGSSKGVCDDSVARDARQLSRLLQKTLDQFPSGVLVEELIAGTDVTVGLLEGVHADSPDEEWGGVLHPVDYNIEPSARSKYNIYDYRLKSTESSMVSVRCPADLPRDVQIRLRSIARNVFRAIGVRDMGRIDFRLGDDGRIYLLEVNALPSLEKGSSLFSAAAREGLTYDSAIQSIVHSAALRWKLPITGPVRSKKRDTAVRVGFIYNMKRVDSKTGGDAEAEFDPPETINAISDAISSHGHAVIHLEATPDLPRLLAESGVDLVFNIAEGVGSGVRGREAQVPALCEIVGIPYTGSDSSTLAIALDKALTKKVLKQHGILTPEFQLMQTGRERLSPNLKFPVIVKPNAEGSSKGIGSASVCDDEARLRTLVRELAEKYDQPALVEEYITGREFTVGLLGGSRPRVLPPMEILFKDKGNERPVYDYTIKQEWEKHVSYECPAKLTATELENVKRAARDTFLALGCRDVARVDLRMNAAGLVYVLEANPLPGLTPDYSDLVLISKAANISYHTLIGEILAGGLKRLREKRRDQQEDRAEAKRAAERAEKPVEKPAAAVTSNGNGGNGNGNGHVNGNGNGKLPGGAVTSTKPGEVG